MRWSSKAPIALLAVSGISAVIGIGIARGASSGDKTTGSGKSTGLGQIHVNARSDAADPLSARGRYWLKGPQPLTAGMFNVSGQVFCHVAAGNVSTTVGTVEKSNEPRFTAIVIRITDGGEPGGDGDRHHVLFFSDFTPEQLAGFGFCNTPLGGSQPITNGNYRVTDGSVQSR